MEPWWGGEQAAWIGAIGGSALGIFGGVFGTVAGICAPRGKWKTFVYSLIAVGLTAGIVMLTSGIFALAIGQPYAVWYPLLLGGLITTLVIGGNAPVIAMRYRQADMRRLEAEELRRS